MGNWHKSQFLHVGSKIGYLPLGLIDLDYLLDSSYFPPCFHFFLIIEIIYLVFKCLFWVYRWGNLMQETVMLKVSKKGDKGFQVCSVPMKKLNKLASDKHRFWSLEGDFLVLRSYS